MINLSKLTVLTNEEVEAIHRATLRILGEIGIVLSQPEGREILVGAGAKVQDGVILLPPDLVETAMSKVSPQVSLRGRNGEERILGDGLLYWHNLGGARDVYDARTAEKRPALIQDVRDSTRLLDALDSVTTITPCFTPQDVTGALMSLAMYRYALPFTTKPLQGPAVQTAAEVQFAVRMASVVGPPVEVISLSISPISPLTFVADTVEAIIETARSKIAFAPLPCPTAGLTAPFSIVGAIAQQNAEILASVVLAELVQPGLPIIYCGRLAMMEPRTAVSVWGGVELGLASAATVQLGHSYGLPVNVYGFSTNSHILDVQNGYERAINAIIPALAGADELSGIGEMEAGVMSSYAQMVCDNEIANSVHRICRGLVADENALAVDVIAAVMGGPRNFLGQKHTSCALRSGEMFLTHLAERQSWESWVREGRLGMIERSQAEAERLLAEHQVQPLSEDQERELDAIMLEAERKLVSK